jgi:hypothetical protein
MINAQTVSGILEEQYAIRIRPGTKGDCPFCTHHTFSVRKDDTIGTCFHPSCGRHLTISSTTTPSRQGLYALLETMFRACHQALLDLPQHPYLHDAYQYLVNQRKIHPAVAADAMLGIIPTGYTEQFDALWHPVIEAAQAAVDAAQTPKARGRPKTPTGMSPADILTWLQTEKEKLRECLIHRAGWLCFFHTDDRHHIRSILFRQPLVEIWSPGNRFDQQVYLGTVCFARMKKRPTRLQMNVSLSSKVS